MTVASPSLARSGAQHGRLRGAGHAPWALLDQMLISATNFITIVLLARDFSRAALGRFTLVYGMLLFVNSVQAGLITQPHNILGVTRSGPEYVRYTSSTALMQLLLALAAALVAALAWGVSAAMGAEVSPLLLALVPAIVMWQLQEFARRVLYTEERLAGAFANDLISYGGQALAIAMLWHGSRLSGPAALYALAATSTLGAMLGLWQIRSSLCRHIDRRDFRENWHFGKWVAGGEIVGHWLSAQLFVYLSAAILGAAAAGILRAVHTIFGPSRVLADVFCTVLPIRFARILAGGGTEALHKQLRWSYLLAVPLLGGYCLLVVVLARPLLELLYGPKYLGESHVLMLYSASAFVSYMTMLVAAALRARRQTRQVFMSQLYASAIAIPIGWVLMRMVGVEGTVLGMIVTYVAMSFLLWRTYTRDREAGPAGSARSAEAGIAAGPSDGPGRILLRLVDLLDEAGIPWCLLHGYASYPQCIRSDVDCLMPRQVIGSGRLARLLHENRQRLGARMVQWVDEETTYIVLAGQNSDGSPCFLQLDISTDYQVKKRRLCRGDEILQGRRRHGPFWVPASRLEFGCYLARKIAKGRLDAIHGRRLSELYQQEPVACRQQIERFWPAQSAALIAAAACSGQWAPVQGSLEMLRAQLLRRGALRSPLSFISNQFCVFGKRLARWCWPGHGLHIVLLGPDGAGKSSLARALAGDLAPAFFSTRLRSFPPALLNRDTENTAAAAPHACAPRSPLNSAFRALSYWLPYCVPGHWLTNHPDRARFKLILHDRHLVDCLVDPRRYRYAGPGWVPRLIWRLMPKPDLVFLLDAPAEIIQPRKREVPIEETARQREAYVALVESMPNGHLIDAAQTPERVAADARALILRHLQERTAQTLGLEACDPAPPGVLRVLKGLAPAVEPADWIIRQIGQGEQARAFSVRRDDGQCICSPYRTLVVKLYKPERNECVEAAGDEFESLTLLHSRLDGRIVNGWKIHCPRPLVRSNRPLALVMSAVPGQSLEACLAQANGSARRMIQSLSPVVVAAMRRYWSGDQRMYGDTSLGNLLCDPAARRLSFIDPGLPERTYSCEGVSRRWHPISRDLAYMLFDVAVSFRALVARPRLRRIQTSLVERVMLTVLETIDSPADRMDLLDEIHACTRVHLRRICVSSSLGGLGRRLVRRAAARNMDQTLHRLRALARNPKFGSAKTNVPRCQTDPTK